MSVRLHAKARIALAFVLTICMVLCALPASALAEIAAPDGEVETIGKGNEETPSPDNPQQGVPKTNTEEGVTKEPAGSTDSLDGAKESVEAQEGTAGETDDGQASEQADAQPAAKEEESATEDEPAKEEDAETKASATTVLSAEAAAPSVSVLTHVQNRGWDKSWVTGGRVAGSTGSGLRMEAMRLRLDGPGAASGTLRYRAHVQNVGWQGWVSDGALCGTSGRGLRVEALQVKLEGELAESYDVVYRVHAQNVGWMGWARNGECAGTAGKGLRLEAIQVALVERGAKAPAAPGQATQHPFLGAEEVQLAAHVQNIGWMAPVGDGKTAGTTGRGLRVEAVRPTVVGLRVPGGVEVAAHVQNIGWQGWRGAGKTAGTTGRGLRVEAVKMRLTGEAADEYDLYYRAHVQNYGWLSWAEAGEEAGSTGLGLRVEGFQTKLVRKGGAAPSNAGSALNAPLVTPLSVSYSTFENGGWLNTVKNGATSGSVGKSIPVQGLRISVSGMGNSITGGVTYRAFVHDSGWSGWGSDGAQAGAPGSGKYVEAIQAKLTGDAQNMYDIWYRAHVQNYGWLGWAKNGASAGTNKQNLRVEAIQIRITGKGGTAPGSTTSAYFDNSKMTIIDKYLATAVAIANNNSHGYTQGDGRWGPDYDCSSLVITSLRSAGLNTGSATYTGNMLENLRPRGWNVMNFTSLSALQRGDILLTPFNHTEFYLGNGKNVRAWMSENGTAYGRTGDQNGHEIEVVNFHGNGSHGWDYVLRLK